MKKSSQMSEAKLWMLWKLHGSEEEPEPGPLGSAYPEFCLHSPYLCDFLENHSLGEKMKLIKEMSNHLTDFPDWPACKLGDYLS